MMINGDLKGIQDFEKIWRKNHLIKNDEPSTIFLDPVKSGAYVA